MAKEKAAAEKETPKYNVVNLAEDLGKSPAEVRVLLRKSGLEKEGGQWGWDKKSDYDSALKELKSLMKPKAEKAPARETDAPAKAKSTGKKKAAA